MKRLLLTCLLLTGSPISAIAQVQLNPYQVGMEYCNMVKSGISRKKRGITSLKVSQQEQQIINSADLTLMLHGPQIDQLEVL